MEKFRKLGISEQVLKSIKEARYEEPTEIQEKAIPLILDGKDVIAGAMTGSGKTLVFASGIVHKIEHGKGIQSLILTPTRELAEQVTGEMTKFSKHKNILVAKVYGGVSINPQIDNLRYADIVVGTPGRILDHLERRTIRLEHVKILVLDEADRMLDMGFIDDVERIIRSCPKQRQTLLFSATITSEVVQLAQRYMINPVEVSAESYVDASKLKQIYYDVPDGIKFSLLVHLLRQEASGLVMVFCNTQRNTDFVARNLRHAGLKVLAIHGGHSQSKRSRTMELFNSNKADVLVCTDVAARGLDIKGVSNIYNYDIPKDSKEYIHRIGRTARAGKEGKAVSLIISRDYENFNRVIEDDNLAIQKAELPYVEKIQLKLDERDMSRSRFHRGERHGGYGRGSYGGNRSEGGRGSYGGNRSEGGHGSYGGNRSEGGHARNDSRGYGSNNDNRSNYSSKSNFGNRYSSGERRGSYGNRGFSQRGSGNRSNDTNRGRFHKKSSSFHKKRY